MSCSRCGTCCRKGGPTLHEADMQLITREVLGRADLVTLRRGELVHDPIKGRLVELEQEVLKLKGVGGSRDSGWCCRLFDEQASECRIHEAKPAECAALDCKEPDAFLRTHGSPRLERGHLLQPGSAMDELVREHEAKCAFAVLTPLAQKTLAGDKAAAGQLVALVEYDRNLRAALIQKTGAKEGELAFFFGRPLVVALEAFGLHLERKGKGSYAMRRIEPRSRPF